MAFLRGINVGGHKIIKMETLKQMFVSMKFKNVRTFIQSGNVIFESSGKNPTTIINKIETTLKKLLGYEVQIVLRTDHEMEEIIAYNPFKKISPDDDLGMYVTLLAEESAKKIKPPSALAKKGFEILKVHHREVYSLALPLPDGRYGNPAAYIEKEFGGVTTTRNWTTMNKITELL